MQGKVTRVAGDNVEISDPKETGITTTVDLKKMDIDTKDPTNHTKIKSLEHKDKVKRLNPGQTILASETEKKTD